MKTAFLILLFSVSATLCRADGLYSVYVFYKGLLTDEEKATVKKLEDESKKGFYNFKAANPSSSDFDWKDYAVWKLQDQKAQLPRIVLRFPESLKIKENAWDAPLTIENASSLLASERRDEIVRLLRKGAAAVWIFAGSGQEEIDQPVETMFRTAFADFAKSQTSEKKASFPVVTLMPETRNERVLFSILSKVKGNHDGLKTPALIPIIGKGQVVSILSGKTLTRENILKLCSEIASVPPSREISSLSPDEKIFLCLKWGKGGFVASSGEGSSGPDSSAPSGSSDSLDSPAIAGASGSAGGNSIELGPRSDKLSFGSVSFDRYYSFLLLIPFFGIMALIVYAIAKSDKKKKRS